MKKIFNKEVIIGLCVIAAMAILFFGINFLKGVNLFKAVNFYYASFTNVQGLAVSAPVTLNGFQVGLVRDIHYEYDNPGHVLVEISLDKDLKVPAGSEAVITSDILGTATVMLKLSDSKDYHIVGDRLKGVTASGMLDAVSENLMPEISQIMPRVTQLLDNLNNIVGDSAVTASVKRLDAITADLQATTRNLAAATGKLGPVATDVKSITGSVDSIANNLVVISNNLRNAPIDQLMGDMQATTDNLKRLTQQLNDPNSSLGLLINDPTLYNNLNTAVSSLDSLLVDIKKNPKRYINVKVF